jgi:hypothetical protein
LSAVALLREASKSGVWIGLDGDKLALRAKARPPDELLDRLRRNKPEIVALLRQAACAIRPAGYSDVEWLAAVADAHWLGYPPGESERRNRACNSPARTRRRNAGEVRHH